MKRRDLFKLAGPAAAALAIPNLSAKPAPIVNSSNADSESEMELYRGFRIAWRGWFDANNQEGIVCRWIAYGPDLGKEDSCSFCVYSCYPGCTSKFFGDMIFNVAVQIDQETPTRETSLEKLELFRQDAKDRLFKYIDEHYEGLVNGVWSES